MNFGNDLLTEGFVAQLDIHGEKASAGKPGLVHDRTGKRFFALLNPAPPVDPSFDLGPDLRELTLVHVKKGDDPGILINDTISLVSDPTEKLKVRKREDSIGSVDTQFWATKVVAGVDS